MARRFADGLRRPGARRCRATGANRSFRWTKESGMKKISMDVDARAERRRRIAAALRRGVTVSQCAVDFGVAESTVRLAGREFRVDLRPINAARLREPMADRNEQICRAFRGGATLQEVADKHGLTRQRAHAIVQCSGLEAKDGGAYVAQANRRAAFALWLKNREDARQWAPFPEPEKAAA